MSMACFSELIFYLFNVVTELSTFSNCPCTFQGRISRQTTNETNHEGDRKEKSREELRDVEKRAHYLGQRRKI